MCLIQMKTFTIITIAIHQFLEPKKIKLIDTALVHRSFDTSWTVDSRSLQYKLVKC